MNRASSRELWIGLVVVAGLAGLLGLLGLASGGPAFLTSRRSIDVIYRDGQGIRIGSPVRVAGLDSGRVEGLDLIEVDGALRARVRIALPTELAAKLRQDVKITIQASITGQSAVNIVSSGRSGVALVPGQVVQGVETSFFDPILEQVGLGPVERSHLSHTIEEVRKTVDVAGPRARQILGSLEETADGLRATAATAKPSIEASIVSVEKALAQANTLVPRVQATLARLETLAADAGGLVAENRPNLQATLASVRDLTATVQDVVARDRGKVEALVDGLNGTRQRADRVLYQADLLAGQGVEILTRNKANLERTFTNVRDASSWGEQLVEKLYGNPFYLSPFYKPTAADKQAQVAFDSAHALVKGVKELSDTVTTLKSMQERPTSDAQKQELVQLYHSAETLRNWMDQATRRLANDLQAPEAQSRARR